MNAVLTPDGWGQVLRTQSAHGRTSYLVKGAGFEGWYDGLQVQADFADHPDEVIPNMENETTLPYPSRPQGPGWDGTTSTIPPDIDPHIEMDGNSDSLTGEPSSDDAVGADLDSDFEPNPHLAGTRARRLHFAALDDPILDVSALPEESPTGLENSPINPDGVSTDDLFEGGGREHFAAVYDHLVIEDGLSFMKFAADEDGDGDDDKKKHHHEQGGGNPFANDDDDDDSDDDDSDDSDSDSSSDGGDGDGGGDGGGGHTAAFREALTTTSDLHFLANFCVCAEELPLHSKSEHRELLAEGGLKNRKKKNKPMGTSPLTGHHGDHDPKTPAEAGYVRGSKAVGDLTTKKKKGTKRLKVERPLQHAAEAIEGADPQDSISEEEAGYGQDQLFHPGSLDLVDDPTSNEDGADLYNHYASTKTAAPAAPPQPTQIESQIEQLMQFWAVDNNGWWHWTGSQSDLALLNQMQQQMMAVGMPSGAPGEMQAQSSFDLEVNTPAPWREYLQTVASDKMVALAAWRDVVDKSKRLRSEGAIDLEVFKPEVITAFIQGDHGRYYTTVQRLGSAPNGAGRQLTSTQVSGWSCECDWGHWAWIRKRSFVGRMCSHAYALFSEMRSLDAKARRGKGKPLSAGKFASTKTAWTRDGEGFVWVTDDPTTPTAAISRTASGWNAQIWSDGTAEDSLDLGNFQHSKSAVRAVGRIINAAQGDVQMAGDDTFKPFEDTGYDNTSPYAEDGAPEPVLDENAEYDEPGGPGVQESQTRTGSLFAFAEAKTGDDDEGPEEEDNGIEEESPDDDDDESLDEEIAEDEDGENGDDGQDDEGDEQPEPEHDDAGDGGHYEPHKRDDSDDGDEGEGTDNPGDDSDDDHVEKTSSVAELQQQYGLTHLAGANYSLAQQAALVGEGEGKTARNHADLNLAGTHYEASTAEAPEDTLAFLF